MEKEQIIIIVKELRDQTIHIPHCCANTTPIFFKYLRNDPGPSRDIKYLETTMDEPEKTVTCTSCGKIYKLVEEKYESVR